MKVFIAGATGAIGTPLIRLLVVRGHEVLGLTRDAQAASKLKALGAVPIIGDALDRDGLLRALTGHSADAVIHELTALKKPPLRASAMTRTNHLRTAGTANLIAAAERLGAKRMITQSIILGYGLCDHGDVEITERHSFGVPRGDSADEVIGALHSAEAQTFAMPEGIALRYGFFYGGDALAMREALAAHSIPAANGNLLGWIHHHDAAVATVAALERGQPGQAYNIVDDRPASFVEVFDAMAIGLGAPRPRRLPRMVFRVVAPWIAAVAFDSNMRVSNAKAKRELGWEPRYKTYREGIAVMAAEVATETTALPRAAVASRR